MKQIFFTGKVFTTFTPQLLRKFFDKPIKPQKT